MADSGEKAELKKVLGKLNLLMIVLVVELIPITLMAAYFLVMIVSHAPFFGGD